VQLGHSDSDSLLPRCKLIAQQDPFNRYSSVPSLVPTYLPTLNEAITATHSKYPCNTHLP